MDSSKVYTRGPASGNTGYTYSRSSSYSTTALDFEKEQRLAPAFESPRMSRRSLRLHTTIGGYGDDSLLDFPLNHNMSYSAGVASRRESKVLKSRRSQQLSVSCVTQPQSQSLLPTPRKSQSQSLLQSHNSSLHSCAASDASLLSSMLDESSIQERTLVDGFWGLDDDTELKERTCLANHSHGTELLNGVGTTAQTQTSMVNGSFCKDCTIHSDRKEALTTYTTSRYPTSASTTAAVSRSAYGDRALAAPATSPPSTVYGRDKSRKNKSGLLVSLWHACVRVSRRAAASVACVLTLLFHDVLLRRTHTEGKGMLLSMLDTGLHYSRRAAVSTVSGLAVVVQAALLKLNCGGRRVVDGAHSSYCGSMNVNELSTDEKHPNSSLCDDCKGKQHSETHTVCSSSSSSSWASRSRHLLWALWGASAYTGSGVLWMGQKAGSAGWAVTRRVLSGLWLAAMSPGKAVTGAFWWLGTGWYHLVTLMSLLNVFILTRCLPKLRTLLLFLLPFLLLLALLYWGPSSLLSVLPAINITEWRTVTPLEQAIDSQSTMAPPLPPPPASAQQDAADVAAVSVDSERLARLEQSLSQLWEKVEGGGQRLERQHGEVLGFYHSLQEQLDTQTDRDSMGMWVSGLLEERLSLLKGEVEKDTTQRGQTQEQYEVQQQGQESRLADLEARLQALSVKTEDVQKRQETAASAPAPTPVPVPVSVGVDSESHDALLAEVQRLEAALGSIRQDLQGVMGCQGMCDRLDSLHDTVSAQVRQELQSLFYGSQRGGQDQAEPGEGEVPEPLLQWLSERYVSGTDLQASLASLELSILQNVTLQLEQSRQQEQTPSTETLTQTVEHIVGAAGAGMSEEHVQLVVKNALRLYSQDRTGQVDYALESGGGSILSTRCSETYETKTALMSLFGLPLWYFSQSPRVVIQPDVQPGNCWAFKGSNGYLVIRLSMKIRPTAFSFEHIPKSLSPTGIISSAPRQLTVYGLDDEYHVEGKLLGSYTYQDDGDALQTYPVSEENDQAYQIIEFRVLSNWGHQEYTCLYRIRVHGEPSETC